MIDTLTEEQIDHVLFTKMVGRIGCHADGKTYVVPVAYAFDGTHIYAHSRVGQKILMMRKNPRVCFQVDDIDNLANWRSVVVDGEYEELTSPKLLNKASKLLGQRLTPFVTSDAAKPADNPPGEKKMRPVFFRILIKDKTGRFEKKG